MKRRLVIDAILALIQKAFQAPESKSNQLIVFYKITEKFKSPNLILPTIIIKKNSERRFILRINLKNL